MNQGLTIHIAFLHIFFFSGTIFVSTKFKVISLNPLGLSLFDNTYSL